MTDAAAPESGQKATHGSGAGAGGSLDGLSVNFASLELAPLSLATPHPLLGGSSDADFDPDEFLCSRATGTKLHSIVAELEAHHEELQQHLLSLVQSHAPVFRQLRTDVLQDAPTVDQLGQVNLQLALAVSASRRNSKTAGVSDALVRRTSLDAPSQAGIDHVRRVVERTREQLQGVKAEVDVVMQERTMCTQIQSQLSVLLALHQCILRLETLLGIPASSLERRRISRTVSGESASSSARNASGVSLQPSAALGDRDESGADEDDEEDEADAILNSMGGLSGTGAAGGPFARMEEPGLHGFGGGAEEQDLGHDADVEADLIGLYTQVGEDMQHAFALEESAGADPLSALVPSLSTSAAPQMSPKSRRKSLAARRRSSAQSISMSQATTALWLPSQGAGTASGLSLNPLPEVLPLPQRLAKALDELLHLTTLVRQALKDDLRPFVQARTRRLTGIANALASDLKMLLSQLLDSSSFIFRPVRRITPDTVPALLRPDANDAAVDSLLGWTQVDKEGMQDDLQVVKLRRQEQFTWLRLSLRSYAALDGLLRSAGSIGTDAASSASEALRQDLDATLRRGYFSRWIRERLRSSAYTSLIKHAAEPGAAARDARVDAKSDGFPAPLEGTPQIAPFEPNSEGLDHSEEGDLRSSEALRRLYNEVLRFLAEDSRALVRAAQASKNRDSDWTVDVFGTLWDELSQPLLEDLGNVIFFVGRPHSFQQNFNLTAKFLQQIARLAPSEDALRTLQGHPTFVAFQKRWQLSVYFRIRLRTIITALEAGLSNGLAPVRRATSVEVAQLQGVQATLEAFAAPWRPRVHLRPLTAREWTLSLQIVSRFKTWLENEVLSEAAIHAANGVDSSAASGHRRTPSGNAWMSATNGGPDSPKPRGRIDSPGPGESRQQRDSDDQHLLRWTWIASDVEWLEASLWKVFHQDIVPAVQTSLLTDLLGGTIAGADEVIKDMNDALLNALSYRRGFVSVLGRNIVASLKQRCAASFEVLNRTGSITRQYRSGGTGASAGVAVPSQTFVVQMIAPLREYFGIDINSTTTSQLSLLVKDALSRVDPVIRSSWAQDVVDDVVARYATALLTMNKTLESLRRLKRGSTTLGFGSLFGGGGSSAHAASGSDATAPNGGGDTDPETVRTRKQMQADIAAFEEEVKALENVGLSVQLEGRETWNRLLAAASGLADG